MEYYARGPIGDIRYIFLGLLILACILFTVFYFFDSGVFQQGAFISSSCYFPEDFSCKDFSITDKMRFTIVNRNGQDVFGIQISIPGCETYNITKLKGSSSEPITMECSSLPTSGTEYSAPINVKFRMYKNGIEYSKKGEIEEYKVP